MKWEVNAQMIVSDCITGASLSYLFSNSRFTFTVINQSACKNKNAIRNARSVIKKGVNY